MCLAVAYHGTESGEPILREIAHIRLDRETIEMENLFGESKTVKGKIREIDFMSSKVIIEK